MNDNMVRYVCGFLVDDRELVVLLRKLQPKWQHGKLNGVGGKIEQGEQPLAAMHREWGEETGNDTQWDWQRFATQQGEGYIVHFYMARVQRMPKLPAQNDVGEHFEYRYLKSIINDGPDPIIPNVRWLLMARCRDPQPLFIAAKDMA